MSHVTSTKLQKYPSASPALNVIAMDQNDFSDDEAKTPQTPHKKRKRNDDTNTEEIRLLRQVIISEKSKGRPQEELLKHNYFTGGSSTIVDGTPLFVALNSIANGTDPYERLGGAINNHSLTLKMLVTYLPVASPTLAAIQPRRLRIIIFRSIVPTTTPPVYADIYDTTTTPITDGTAMLCTLNSGTDILAVRNYLTFDQYHVLYDKFHAPVSNPLLLSATTGVNVGEQLIEIYVDFHRSNTTFFDVGVNDIVTNGLTMIISTNSTINAYGQNMGISFTGDMVYSDAPMS